MDLTVTESVFIQAFEEVSKNAHQNAASKGWWDARNELMEVAARHSPELGKFAEKAITGLAVALTHSELSEGLEGERKDLMDDKIPEFSAIEAEYADTIIRLMDHAVSRNMRLAEAIVAKMRMNQGRPHMHGGKAF